MPNCTAAFVTSFRLLKFPLYYQLRLRDRSYLLHKYQPPSTHSIQTPKTIMTMRPYFHSSLICSSSAGDTFVISVIKEKTIIKVKRRVKQSSTITKFQQLPICDSPVSLYPNTLSTQPLLPIQIAYYFICKYLLMTL